MKVGKDYFAEKKSSFLALEKDYSIILDKIFDNQDLLKMLYYSQKDCLQAEKISAQQKLSMINKQIKIVPKIEINPECPIYMIITMDNFKPNATNPEFRDCTISFDILCHPDHWNLGNFKLRPYKIAGEIDEMFNNQTLTGIGRISLLGGDSLVLNDDLMGVSLMYQAIHGIEDKIDPLS